MATVVSKEQEGVKVLPWESSWFTKHSIDPETIKQTNHRIVIRNP